MRLTEKQLNMLRQLRENVAMPAHTVVGRALVDRGLARWSPVPYDTDWLVRTAAGTEALALATLRCLSVKQPWAELIASGQKPLELRTKSLKWRGKLVICASAARSRDADAELHQNIDGAKSRAVALVELVDCFPALPTDADRACCKPGPKDFAWELKLLKRLDFAPFIDLHVKGSLGIFLPPADLLEAIKPLLK